MVIIYQPKVHYTEYYAVNDRPVKVIEFEDGSADVFVYEWSTGRFVPDRSYWEHIHGGNAFKDVDQLTREQFDQLVDPLRTQAVIKHVTTPITWDLAIVRFTYELKWLDTRSQFAQIARQASERSH